MNDGRRYSARALARISTRGRTAAALVALCGVYVGPAHAQAAAPALSAKSSEAAEAAADAAEDAKDAIVVTGQPKRGAVATEVPPETTLNATAIHALGAADLDEVFTDLAPEIGTGAGGASGNGTIRSGQAPIVLVNGQRISGFSSIKDLPPEAVRRIEIFPEKVALQYGYDAGQRVVNVVLRSNYKALTLLGRYTLAPDNFRGVYRAKVDLLRINENSNWNIDLDYRHQDPIFDDTTLVAPTASTGVPQHTLATQDDHLTITGSTTRKIGAVSAALTGSLDLDALQSRPGLSDEDGDLLAAEGLSDLVTGPLNRVDQTVEAQTNLTLNGRLDAWRWSFIGKLDDTTRVTRTGPAIGSNGMDIVLLPSPGLLGDRCGSVGDTGCVSTDMRTAGGDFYLNGNLLSVPAGPVTTALRTGFAFSGIRSDSPSALAATDLTRNEGNVQGNVDVPLSSDRSPLGKLSIGGNGELRQLSDFGTLTTYGATLDWVPTKRVDLLASFTHSQQAPTLLQLGEASLDTPDLREFDFVTNSTTIVQRIAGGTADLDHQTSQTGRVRLQVSPLRTADLQLSAEYTIDKTRNPIVDLSAATAATMAAFPDRFERDNGYLTVLDTSPVNLARRDRQQMRFGLNYSTAFGSTSPAVGSVAAPARDQFQIALYDTWRLRDEVVLRDGMPALNLLGHDVISDTGGTPTHQVELQTTVSTAAWSADINAVWQTPTTAYAGTLSQDKLTFSQGITLNLRLQINLADQRWLTHIFPALRGSLNLSADNLLGAHTRVHDAAGVVPAAYSEDYINPTGRTFRITLRKRFR